VLHPSCHLPLDLDVSTLLPDIQMIQGDFLKLRTKDWRDADIVFTNSTCYDEKLMEQLAKLASTCDNNDLCNTLPPHLTV
jgi:hypothetical protein